MNNNWEDKLRKDFEEYSESAPDGLWEGVEGRLSSEWSAGPRPLKKGRTILFSAIGTIAAAAVLVLFLVLDTEPHDTLTVVTSPASEVAAVEESHPERGISVVSSAEGADAVAEVRTTRAETGRAYSQDKPEAAAVMTGDTSSAQAVEKVQEREGEEPEAASRKEETEASPDLSVNQLSAGSDAWDGFAEEEPVKKRSSGRMSFSVSASNITPESESNQGYSGLFGSEVAKTVNSVQQDGTQNLSSVLLGNNNVAYSDISTKVTHRQPVKVGVSASFPLTRRLSLETGLTYSYLVSDLTSGSDVNRYETRQKLHYLGIPLNLNVSLWNNHRFDIYLSGGALAEKCIYGTTSTTYITGHEQRKGETEHINVKPVQWSVNASAGAQVNFTKYLGLYLEPGVSYYFDNGSFVETVYNKKTWNFNLRIGLRLMFQR